MKLTRKQKWKIAFVLPILILSVYTALALVKEYQHRAALKFQLEKLETLKEVEQKEYQQQLDQWTKTVSVIQEKNQRTLSQWQRRPAARKMIEVPVAEMAMPSQPPPAAVIADNSNGEDVVAAAPPPPAAMVMPAQPQYVIVEQSKPLPQLETVPPPPAKPPTVIEVSAERVRIELGEDTSWRTLWQLVFLILALYAGIKFINKYTCEPKAEAA